MLTPSAEPADPAMSRASCCQAFLLLAWAAQGVPVLLAACPLFKQPNHRRALRASLFCCLAPACRPGQRSYRPGQRPGPTIALTLACTGAGCMARACMPPTRGESTVVKPEAARAVDLASTSLRLGRSQCRCVAVCITHHMLWRRQGTSNSSVCVRGMAPLEAWLPMRGRKV